MGSTGVAFKLCKKGRMLHASMRLITVECLALPVKKGGSVYSGAQSMDFTCSALLYRGSDSILEL